jgi:hypothetical protein
MTFYPPEAAAATVSADLRVPCGADAGALHFTPIGVRLELAPAYCFAPPRQAAANRGCRARTCLAHIIAHWLSSLAIDMENCESRWRLL